MPILPPWCPATPSESLRGRPLHRVWPSAALPLRTSSRAKREQGAHSPTGSCLARHPTIALTARWPYARRHPVDEEAGVARALGAVVAVAIAAVIAAASAIASPPTGV